MWDYLGWGVAILVPLAYLIRQLAKSPAAPEPNTPPDQPRNDP